MEAVEIKECEGCGVGDVALYYIKEFGLTACGTCRKDFFTSQKKKFNKLKRKESNSDNEK